MTDKTSEFYKISCSVVLGFLANLYDKYSVMLAATPLAVKFYKIINIVIN